MVDAGITHPFSKLIKQTAFIGALIFWIPVFAESSSTLGEKEADNLLARMSEAFSRLNYDGVFVYSHGDNMETMRIFHRVDDGVEKERIVRMDGSRHELIRDGNKVTCVHAADWRGNINHRIPAGPFAKAFIRDVSNLTDRYQLTDGRKARVVGRDAISFAIEPKDQYRYGYRIWIDQQTGLLLKSVLLHRGRVLERFQFTQVNLSEPIPDSDLQLGLVGEVITHNPLTLTVQETIEQKKPNWKLTWLPDGFVMRVQGIRRTYGGKLQADTLTFSDGMTAFSIFIEKASADTHQEMATQVGATVAVARVLKSESGKHFATVVGEVPMQTAKKLADSIVPVSAEP